LTPRSPRRLRLRRNSGQNCSSSEEPTFRPNTSRWPSMFTPTATITATGLQVDFGQDNHSRSARGVLRGLHYEIQQPQGKLVRVVRGTVFDVAVDLRRSSPHFGRWAGVELSEDNHRQLWVPPGFAHGFVVLSESADFLYKTTDYYAPQFERGVRWDDPAIAIAWPLAEHGIAAPLLSVKDAAAPLLADAECFARDVSRC